MYDELVKRLRASVDGRYEKCDGCPYEEDYPCCVDCLDKMHKQAADAIEELLSKLNHDDAQIQSLVEAAEERRWIPVTERLPETYGTRLVATARGAVMVCCYYPQAKNWNTRATVTHWMPLPEPPEEAET